MRQKLWIALLFFGLGNLSVFLVVRHARLPAAHVVLPVSQVPNATVPAIPKPFSTKTEVVKDSWHVRAQTFADFKRNRRGIVMSAVNDDSVDMVFALMMGLTSADIARLNRSLASAKERIETLRESTARLEISPDKKTKIITLPALGAEMTPIYKSVLSEFADVLGPERYDLFNQVAGESFDGLFDHFGANTVVYEIATDPIIDEKGRMTYQYKRTSRESGPMPASYWSNRTFIDGEKDDPIVMKFIHTAQQ